MTTLSLLCRCALLAAWLASAAPQAAVIDIAANRASLPAGASVTIDISISGLSAAPGASLSAFDIDLLFDPGRLALSGYSFADASVRNPLDWPEPGAFGFSGAATATGARIDVFGLSGNTPGLLDAAQDDSFRFLQLRFHALAPASATSIAIDVLDPAMLFVDSGAGLLGVTFAASAVTLAITPGVAALPEPGALPLVGAGLAAAWLCRRGPGRRRRPGLLAGAALALTLTLGLGDAAAQSPVPPPATPSRPSAAPPAAARASETATAATAAAGPVSGVIAGARGMRVQVRMSDGSLRWFSLDTPPPANAVGKKISGVAVQRGDAQLIGSPYIGN